MVDAPIAWGLTVGARPHANQALGPVIVRIALAMLALFLAVSTLLSALVIAELHDHECSGDDCPTCLVLEISLAVLSSVAAGPLAALPAATVALALGLAIAASMLFLPADTLVNLKVRLVI